MSDNQITLTEKVTLFLGGTGNVAVEVPAGTVVTVLGANSRDELAELLATNVKVYAESREQLAHEVTRDHVWASGEEPRKAVFKVSYGLHGARVESGPFEAVEDAPEQPASEPVAPNENENPVS